MDDGRADALSTSRSEYRKFLPFVGRLTEETLSAAPSLVDHPTFDEPRQINKSSSPQFPPGSACLDVEAVQPLRAFASTKFSNYSEIDWQSIEVRIKEA